MKTDWLDSSIPFLQFLNKWYLQLSPLSLGDITEDPLRVAIVSVDVINGFCHEGPLSSPRVKSIIEPISTLFEAAWGMGVRRILLTQDAHEPDAVEFAQFPPHCVRGTSESMTVPEFRRLPFFDELVIMEKNSIHSGLNTVLNEWIASHPEIENYIVVGDCTDLCTYQLAMHLRLDANARQLSRRVILPVNCVDTYDIPIDTANEINAVPHDAELLHRVFLYSMMLNGIEIAASIS